MNQLLTALKAGASQLIVLHHLAFYGPMSDAAYELAPHLLGWLSAHARLAVQIFLVVGGFLSAKSLALTDRLPAESPLILIGQRYCRLALPYMAALGIALACAAIARNWLPMEATPGRAHVKQLVAHLLFLQNLLGFEALSAGLWYVAIDFQLYALILLLVWLAQMTQVVRISRRPPGMRPLPVVLAGVCMLTLASLFHFNRDAAWDNWAIYFFGAYGMGMLAYWTTRQKRALTWLAMIALVGTAALLVDFRSRIATALATALLLGLAGAVPRLRQWLNVAPLAFLGRISYSLFLVHFPVCLIINAVVARRVGEHPGLNALGLLLAWGASLAAAIVFHCHVELPTAAWQRRLSGGNLALRSRQPIS